LLGAVLLGGVACSPVSPLDGVDSEGSGGTGQGGDGDLNVDKTPPGAVVDDPRLDNGIPLREEVCDSTGNCTCLRLALLGTLNTAADDKDTSAFQDWLNDNSGGTATVEMVTTKPDVNAEFLESYDILIVANVNGWTFSESEKAAVAEWSARGGGIVSLTGFESTQAEAADTSQLIAFAGLGYTGTTNADFAANNGQSVPVYYQGANVDLKNCLAWTGSSDAIITTPIQFLPQTGTMADLTFELDYVGAYVGWGVTGSAEATVLATDPTSGKNMAMATEVNGAGRVLAFGDEWIVFANQWEPTGNPHNLQEDEYNICYAPAQGGQEAFFHSVRSLYQTKQFWYNAITWVAPPNECHFVVQDIDVVIR